MIHVPRSFVDNPIHTQIGRAKRASGFIYSGTFNSLILFGPEGIGKTFIVEQVAASFGVPFDLQRPGTVLGLKHLLIEGTVPLVLDDCDWLYFDRNGLNTYNMAFDNDNKRPRIISHTTATGNTTIPPTEIKRGFIQISNLDFWDLDQFSLNIRPVISRPLRVELSFNDLDVYEYTCGLVVEQGMLQRAIRTPGQRDRHLSRAFVNEILRLFCDNANRLQWVTPRAINMIAYLRARSDYRQWLDDCETQMLPEGRNPRVFKNAAGEVITKLHCYQIPEGRRTPKRAPPPREPTEEEVAEVQGVIDEMIDAGILDRRDPPPITVTKRPPDPPITIPVTVTERPDDSGRGGYEAVGGDDKLVILHPDLSFSAMDAASASTDNAEVESPVVARIAEVKERIEAGRAARLAAIEDTPWWRRVTAADLVDRHIARVREGSPPMTVAQHLALDGITDPEWRDRFEGHITRGLAPPRPTHATSSGKMIPAKPAGRFHHQIGIVYLPKPPGKRGRPSKEKP